MATRYQLIRLIPKWNPHSENNRYHYRYPVLTTTTTTQLARPTWIDLILWHQVHHSSLTGESPEFESSQIIYLDCEV